MDPFDDYVSPYVEIRSSSLNSSVEVDKGSINSFLQEAEIVHPALDTAALKECEQMRKKLRSFFMNPIEKWKERGRFPWKFCVQVLTIILATIQMCLFGIRSFEFVRQHSDMTSAISHILLKDWTQDVAVYPPSNGPYAVYTVPEFYEHINYVIQQYSTIDSLAIGSYGYDDPNGTLTALEFCSKHYEGSVFAGNSSIEIKDFPEEKCIDIPPLYPSGSSEWKNFRLEDFLESSNNTLHFQTLVQAKLHFRLRAMFLKSLSRLDVPECFRLRLMVLYDNSEHDGQVAISLLGRSIKIPCHVNTTAGKDGIELYYLLRQLLNSSVILSAVMSCVLCLRSLYSGYSLAAETNSFFDCHYHKRIPFWELLDFIDFWYVNVVASDIMLIFGSLIKLQIEERSAEGVEWARCSILLGVGNLLIWMGILRYLGFFPKYNMLILTLKRALPNVLRFLICAIFLFLGYCFCGWIVLAPYHIKFQTLSRTAECLFAIMNGDDMFATFALLDTNFNLVWWFARFFLYSFLLLFVYIVVSLFISVIMDTFETIKHIYMYGAPPSTMVEIFLASESESSSPMPCIPASRQPKANCLKQAWKWVKDCLLSLSC